MHLHGYQVYLGASDCTQNVTFDVYGASTINTPGGGGSFQASFHLLPATAQGSLTWQTTINGVGMSGYALFSIAGLSCSTDAQGRLSLSIPATSSTMTYMDDGGSREQGTFSTTGVSFVNANPGGTTVPAVPVSFDADFTPGAPPPPPPTTTSPPPSTEQTTTIATTTAEITTTVVSTTSQTTTVATTTAEPPAPKPALVLPDRTRTPGVTNPAVTQATIKKTICASGWVATIRPPVSYTIALKLKQMKQYGEKGKPSAYEEDHLIPLELGGAPRNPKNLWPEPHSQSTHSDPLKTALKHKVCAGKLTLAAARTQIVVYKRKHG